VDDNSRVSRLFQIRQKQPSVLTFSFCETVQLLINSRACDRNCESLRNDLRNLQIGEIRMLITHLPGTQGTIVQKDGLRNEKKMLEIAIGRWFAALLSIFVSEMCVSEYQQGTDCPSSCCHSHLTATSAATGLWT
jgi:hypothetical protein